MSWIGWAVVVTSVAVLGASLFFVYQDEAAWKSYADAHCHIIGEMHGSTGVGSSVGPNGVGVATVYVPGKTGYRCDDGKDHWR